MDKFEAIAHKYLETLGFDSLVYEPDGNIPPDFLADGKIAIEVTRLAQHHFHGDRHRGLEETAIPLWESLGKILKEFRDHHRCKSYFVFLEFQRPLPKLKILKPKFREKLHSFLQNPVSGPITLRIDKNLSIEVIESTVPDSKDVFMMGGSIDFDSGGFILSEMERNLQICLEKKKNAVEKYRTRYPEWWLILPDKIGYGLSQSNRRSFRDAFSINHEWDKIILINPIKPKDAFIIESE